jgi:hypothetical protein
MAKQKGIVQIEGTMGNLTFYKSQDGMMVKEKSAVSKERIMNDPHYRRTRENMAEFGNAAASSKMLMEAVHSFIKTASDNRVSSRLNQAMKKVLLEDKFSARGARNVAAGIKTDKGKSMLKQFNFNKFSNLGSVLHKQIILSPVTGTITINDVNPVNDIVGPKGASHVTLSCVFVTVEFATGKYYTEYSEPVELALDNTLSNVQLIPDEVPTLTPDTTSFYLIKMEFYQEVNGEKYSLNNENFNCVEILDVK